MVEVLLHPNFRFTPQADRYDVAVLELDRAASYKDNIKPICLPQKDATFVGRVAYVAGWGALQAGECSRQETMASRESGRAAGQLGAPAAFRPAPALSVCRGDQERAPSGLTLSGHQPALHTGFAWRRKKWPKVQGFPRHDSSPFVSIHAQ